MTMTDELTDIVAARPGASFPEIQGLLGDDSRGDYTWGFREDLVGWVGLSEAFCDALLEARDKGAIHPHLLQTWFEIFVVHTCDGGFLGLPVAKRPPRNGYKQPHWTPIVWHPGRSCNARNCIAGKT